MPPAAQPRKCSPRESRGTIVNGQLAQTHGPPRPPRQNVRTSNPAISVSTRRAVALGHLAINLPALLMLGTVGIVVVLRYLSVGAELALTFGAGALSWLWWAFTVPRWRQWAIRRGVEAEALQRVGQRTGLVWPEGSWMSKTEFRPRE